ncbi:methyl-accepting chemotaxis protein [Treponema sp.]|uniref:methyl-accepting chemotaxis protein n=1 Tax=Treponema sp. TaxID=166 RepID=UPI0025F1E713|nr:methyl-accepting chemotaxis protein [Treponema sp.]MCR5218507.1 methyl-accepting chemotaxis protein [Treponema sp.]
MADTFSFDSKNAMTPKSFTREMYISGIIPNIILSIIVFLYIFYISGLLENGSSQNDFSIFMMVSVIIVFGSQFIAGPFTNSAITKKTSARLYKFYTQETDCNERTQIIKELSHISIMASFVTVLTFLTAFIFEYLALFIFFDISRSTVIFICISALQCIFMAAIYALNYAENICSKKACDVSAKGLNEKTVLKDKFYGRSLSSKLMIIFAGSFFASSLSHSVFFISSIMDKIPTDTLFIKTGIVLFINSLICIVTGYIIVNRISKSFSLVNSILEKFTDETLEKNVNLPVTFNDEISYNFYLINRIINFISDISKDTVKYSSQLASTISTLTEVSEKNAELSLEQSEYTSQVMEEMNNAALSLNQITEKITRIRINAEETKSTVNGGVSILKETISKMAEISDANLNTITGIKELSEKIDNVWASINTIETIAEKTRIISFNAELEASYAGEHGEKFHIVANEIRRLASTISDSIKEIKDRILIMQHSSDNLIITSEASTQKVKEGSDIYINLMDEQFNEVKMTSDITTEAATRIQRTTENQSILFNEIITSLKEISGGFVKLSESAEDLHETSQIISQSSDILTSIIKKEEADVR